MRSQSAPIGTRLEGKFTSQLSIFSRFSAALITSGQIYLPRRVEIQRKNAEADNQIRPRGETCGRNNPGSDDRDICQRIVSGGEEGRAS